MNSLNILSSHVSPSLASTPSRSNSISALGLAITPECHGEGGGGAGTATTTTTITTTDRTPAAGNGDNAIHGNREKRAAIESASPMASVVDETTPLIPQKDMHGAAVGAGNVRLSKWRALPRRIAMAVWNSILSVLHTLAAPGVYLIACLYDANGNFLPLGAFGRRRPARHGKHPIPSPYDDDNDDDQLAFSSGDDDEKAAASRRDSILSIRSDTAKSGRFFSSSALPAARRSSSYAVSSESESDFDRAVGGPQPQQRRRGNNTSSGAGSRRGTTGSRSGEDDAPAGRSGGSSAANAAGNRRSVRIKLNDDTQRQRKHRKGQSSSASAAPPSSLQGGGRGARDAQDSRDDSYGGDRGSGGGDDGEPATKDILAQLKSPTSPAGALTKYPRTPAPPRPLLPRRQPSFLNLDTADKSRQKTLILDLDETLIHSMSKGGRMSTGHMVEVRLNTTFVGIGGQQSVGPQHPILYYVHKRPYCDEFLRRVCKWYNLVVFTASVQEYADPVIDWLESERKYFSARFYRQNCTFRHGAFIKDLSAVEPDLSKVMILDNSPLSYMFHQDNAIPIQGWISDHTDNDLLHLVPLLEGLQHVSDVRALLALRGGEDGRHMA